MARKRMTQVMKGPRGGIELLLTKSVPGLGNPGEVVEVKPGYARNYLLPHGLATRASAHNLRMIEVQKKKAIELTQQRRQDLERLARELAKHSVSIEANANPEGHLYGSVGSEDISKALQNEKFAVDPAMIKLEGPLKELGLYAVKLQLAEDLEAEVKVWVVPAAGVTST